jgi:hypothetical protein
MTRLSLGQSMKTRTAPLLNLLQSIAIVFGLVFGAVQLGQFRSEQRRQANAELARSFLTPELMSAFNLILTMPDSVSYETAQADYGDGAPDLLFLVQTFETVGLMVYRGDVELGTVDDFLGTFIIISWNKLKPMEEQYRAKYNAPSVAEWFQWLAERLQDYRAGAAPPPAYEAFKDWKPSR